MTHIKDNHFTHDVFFKRDKEGFSAVSKKKKRTVKKAEDVTNLPSRNYGVSRGSSQNIIGSDYLYRGDLKVTSRTPVENLVSYFETLPLQMSGMVIVLKEKLQIWKKKATDEEADEMAKQVRMLIKWERGKLVNKLRSWKK